MCCGYIRGFHSLIPFFDTLGSVVELVSERYLVVQEEGTTLVVEVPCGARARVNSCALPLDPRRSLYLPAARVNRTFNTLERRVNSLRARGLTIIATSGILCGCICRVIDLTSRNEKDDWSVGLSKASDR